MAIYICAVSNQFPENYQIGVQACTWGVEERYKERLRAVRPGDRIVFTLGGEFRSVHAVEKAPYEDTTPLWPPKNGDIFRYRIGISKPIAEGAVSVKRIQDRIDFLRGKTMPGPLQGPNGVLNSHLSEAELNMLIGELRGAQPAVQPAAALPAIPPLFAGGAALLLHRADPVGDVARLLERLGLDVALRNHDYGAGSVDLAYRAGRGWTVMAIRPGAASDRDLISILRDMSWIRQTQKADSARGIIVAERTDAHLTGILGEVPNVLVQPCQIAA